MKRLFRKRIAYLVKRFEESQILISEDANFFGLESKGVRQIRGNGVLILTPKVLFFGMWSPKREFEIPIKKITGISRVKNHLYKTIRRELLKIEFLNQDNQIDSIAWYVKDLNIWILKLREIKQN